VISRNVNKARISVPVSAEVKLVGKAYIQQTTMLMLNRPDVLESTSPNIAKVESVMLVHRGNISELSNRLLEHYQRRHETTFRVITQGERLSELIIVNNVKGQSVRGLIVRMDTDLTGGFVTTMSVVGNLVEHVAGYFAGELSAGEEFGVM
jgi:hypothetical protein